jgi:hypothetical protein
MSSAAFACSVDVGATGVAFAGSLAAGGAPVGAGALVGVGGGAPIGRIWGGAVGAGGGGPGGIVRAGGGALGGGGGGAPIPDGRGAGLDTAGAGEPAGGVIDAGWTGGANAGALALAASAEAAVTGSLFPSTPKRI